MTTKQHNVSFYINTIGLSLTRRMCTLPLVPGLAKMVITGLQLECVEEVEGGVRHGRLEFIALSAFAGFDHRGNALRKSKPVQ